MYSNTFVGHQLQYTIMMKKSKRLSPSGNNFFHTMLPKDHLSLFCIHFHGLKSKVDTLLCSHPKMTPTKYIIYNNNIIDLFTLG